MSIDRRSGRRRQPSLFKRDPGQAIVIIALVMIVLLGFVALAIDGGQLYFLQRDAQNAADAAIMAALFELCKDPNLDTDSVVPPGSLTGNQTRAANAIRAGKEAAIENGFDDLHDTVSLPGSPPARSLAIPDSVQVTVTVPYDPGTGLSYNNVEVVIVADKPSELIHLVYQGPLEVRVRTAGYCRSGHPFTQGYAMFGGGTGCNPAINYQGSGNLSIINGGLHSEGNIAVSGSGTDVPSPVEAVGGVSAQGGATAGGPGGGQPSQPFPEIWNLDDFRPGGTWAAIADNADPALDHYFPTTGDLTSLPKNADGTVKQGIYFVDGDVQFNGSDFGGGADGVTIVTTGDFKVSGGIDVAFSPYNPTDLPPMPLIFANAGNRQCNVNEGITISGNDVNWTGVLYAPNGLINVSTSGASTMNGSMVGWIVSVSGSTFTLTYDPDLFPPVRPAIDITG